MRNGGAIVDTAGLNVTIGQALVHSAVVGDNATDGGLTKVGNGTLLLTNYCSAPKRRDAMRQQRPTAEFRA